MPTPIDPTDRARRLGNVAAILIDLGRKRRLAAESGKDDESPVKGDVMETE